MPTFEQDNNLILRERMLHLYGLVVPSSGAVRIACDNILVAGMCGSGRPKMTWKK